MLVLIPVINGKSDITGFFPLPSNRTVNSYDTSFGFTHVYWLKTRISLAIVFESVFAFSCAKFPVQISGWRERFKQLHRRYLMLNSE